MRGPGRFFLRRGKLVRKPRSLRLTPKTDALNTPPFLPRSAAAGGPSAIDSASGVATASTLAGTSTAVSAAGAAAGAATASDLVGRELTVDVVLLGSGGSTTDGTSFATANIDVTSGVPVIIDVSSDSTASSDDQTPTGITGPGGMTFTKVAETNPDVDFVWLSRWVALPSSTASGTCTISFSTTQDVVIWTVVEARNAGPTTSNGADIFAQHVTGNVALGSGTADTETLAAFGSTLNRPLVVFQAEQTANGTPRTGTPEAGWTEIADQGQTGGSFAFALQVQFKDSSTDVTPSVTWSAGTGVLAAIASEIKKDVPSTSSAIDSAAGAATTSTLAGASTAASTADFAAGVATTAALASTSTAVSAIDAAAGAATASALAGASTVAAAIDIAAGAATASTMEGLAVTAAAIDAAAGAATTSTLASTSTAVSAADSAAGVATASALASTSTAVSAADSAAGVATTSTLAGLTVTAAAIDSAAGAATTSTLAGTSTAVAAADAAAGAATASTLAGTSTAAAAITVAASTATASDIVGGSLSDGTASIIPAAGVATTSDLAGTSVAVAAFDVAAGVATAADFAPVPDATPALLFAAGASAAQRKKQAHANPPEYNATTSPAVKPVMLPAPLPLELDDEDAEIVGLLVSLVTMGFFNARL